MECSPGSGQSRPAAVTEPGWSVRFGPVVVGICAPRTSSVSHTRAVVSRSSAGEGAVWERAGIAAERAAAPRPGFRTFPIVFRACCSAGSGNGSPVNLRRNIPEYIVDTYEGFFCPQLTGREYCLIDPVRRLLDIRTVQPVQKFRQSSVEVLTYGLPW